MHAIIGTCGIKKEVDDFITQLQGKYLPFEVKEGAAGLKKGHYNVQVMVRPVQLWDIVFPKQHKDLMLTTLLGDNPSYNGLKYKIPSVAIRKALGFKKIPKYSGEHKLPITQQHMNVVGIGIKDDYDFQDGTEAL